MRTISTSLFFRPLCFCLIFGSQASQAQTGPSSLPPSNLKLSVTTSYQQNGMGLLSTELTAASLSPTIPNHWISSPQQPNPGLSLSALFDGSNSIFPKGSADLLILKLVVQPLPNSGGSWVLSIEARVLNRKNYVIHWDWVIAQDPHSPNIFKDGNRSVPLVYQEYGQAMVPVLSISRKSIGSIAVTTTIAPTPPPEAVVTEINWPHRFQSFLWTPRSSERFWKRFDIAVHSAGQIPFEIISRRNIFLASLGKKSEILESGEIVVDTGMLIDGDPGQFLRVQNEAGLTLAYGHATLEAFFMESVGQHPRAAVLAKVIERCRQAQP